jgi:hypothetical protein
MLGIIGKVINLFSSIVGVVSSPNPFTRIGNILEQIRQLV